jgi:hypothetical protein
MPLSPRMMTPRREHHFQFKRGLVDEFHRDERRLKNRHVRRVRSLQKFLVRL